MEYDLIVRNGVVVDGSGAERMRADVAIKDRKIAALISPADAASATVPGEIDARGPSSRPASSICIRIPIGSRRFPITQKS
jgi:N-acyl-D-aspartate/D-glutamate deacylase